GSNSFRRRYVAGSCQDFTTSLLPDLCGGSFCGIASPRRKRNARALASQSSRHSESQAPARARDHGDLFGESQVHYVISIVLWTRLYTSHSRPVCTSWFCTPWFCTPL